MAERLETQLQTTKGAKAEVVGTVPLAAALLPDSSLTEAGARDLPRVVDDLNVHRVVVSGRRRTARGRP